MDINCSIATSTFKRDSEVIKKHLTDVNIILNIKNIDKLYLDIFIKSETATFIIKFSLNKFNKTFVFVSNIKLKHLLLYEKE